jgi:hypothetical protein
LLKRDAPLLISFPLFHPGALGEVLHCYIFSNTIDVFRNSYQATLAANLLELLTEESKQDRPFLAARGDFLFTADEDAPIDLTERELAQFENRKDITAYREAIKSAAGRERKLLYDRCQKQIRSLSALFLHLKRAQFFEEIDRHRARGSPTDGIRSKALRERTVLSATRSGAAIAQFLQAGVVQGGQAGIIRWMEPLLDNLQGKGPGAATAGVGGRQFQCLLCDAPSATTSALTRHTGAVHWDQLLRPFKCPACAASGDNVIINGPESWSIHCANRHGRRFTPNPVDKPIHCFCGSKLTPTMFASHLNHNHAKRSGPFPCRNGEFGECSKLGIRMVVSGDIDCEFRLMNLRETILEIVGKLKRALLTSGSYSLF